MGAYYLREEKKLWQKGIKRVAGLDEAGRGPLAGPVVTAAVRLFPSKIKSSNVGIKRLLNEARDSKKLTPIKREELYNLVIKNPAIKWKIAKASEKVIDKINIKNATELAMFRAVKKLNPAPNFLIIDGKFIKNNQLKNIKHKLIVKADERVFSCILASIVAKVTRDRIMQKYHQKYPRYGFFKHKGYPTKYHLRMLKRRGPCRIHRNTFGPVKLISKA